MKGAKKKRGTHGLRKRCPVCKRLRKFARIETRRLHAAFGRGVQPRHWRKIGDRWVCWICAVIAESA